MAKAPVPGLVKTRLCPPCTPEDAARVAEAALADTLDAALGSGADRVVLALDGEPGAWLPSGIDLVDQGEGSFNDRLACAWSSTRGPALQIGMDTPQVTSRALMDAFDACYRFDSVIGLACDGGWWSLGLRLPRADVFDGIAPSRVDTGVRQLQRLRHLGLEPALLGEQRDVDAWDDALQVAAVAPRTRFAAAVAAVALVA